MKLLINTIFIILTSIVSVQQVSAQEKVELVLDNEKRAAILNNVAETIEQNYIIEKTGNEMADILRSKLKQGDYDKFKDPTKFYRQLTRDLITVSQDYHIRIIPLRKKRVETPEIEKQELEALRTLNFGLNKLEILNGNIGYLALRSFRDSKEMDLKIAAAMEFLSETKGIIIDLRENGGGSAKTVQLFSSYFFNESVHLTTIESRDPEETEEIWTHTVTGKKLPDIPLFLLTSSNTFSAAEGFTYHLKALGRATVIGEVTSGGAHLTKFIDLPEQNITIRVPYKRSVNLITKTNWEKTGVIPNIEVPANLALEIAVLEMLNQQLDNESDKDMKEIIRFYQFRYQGRTNQICLSQSAKEEYLGVYESEIGKAQIILDKEVLKIHLPGGTLKSIMEPVSIDRFAVMDDYNIEIIRTNNNEIAKIVVTIKDTQGVFKDILIKKF